MILNSYRERYYAERHDYLYHSKKAEFVAVYGRRRVGKTYLIKELFRDKMAFYHTGMSPIDSAGDNLLLDQLKSFHNSLLRYGMEGEKQPETWLDAFFLLEKLLEDKDDGSRQVVFIDELPWMDTPRSGFLSAFEHFWNGWGSGRNNLMLIVCGSATNWIINKFFKQKGGLYNRANSKMFLKPFTLAETEQYLQKQGIEMERYDIAQVYMILGGIPYYLKQLEAGRPLADNIDNCFFKTNGKLWDEFENLYETLFAQSDIYIRIAEALASKRMGLTREEIIVVSKLPDNGALSRALKDLVKCGFVRAYTYYGRKTKTQTYQLADFYTLFYFRFIKDNYGQDEHFWTHILDNPKKNTWLGYSFEQLIKDHIEQVKKALGIASVLTQQSCWFIEQRDLDDDTLSGAQIDLVIDRRDKAINLCEAKFYSGEFIIDKAYSLTLRNKAAAFKAATKTRKSLVPTMITTFGIKRNMYSGNIQQEVTLDDLFG